MNTPASADQKQGKIQFDDNSLLPELFGDHDEHLLQIEQLLDVRLRYRGNSLEISGPETSREIADRVILSLYTRLKNDLEISEGEVKAAVRIASGNDISDDYIQLRTKKRTIRPRSTNQAAYIKALDESDLVFGLGPAGTGKTYLAVAVAVTHLLQGKVDRIILSRPAVEAGERLGYLPGDLQEKIDPYLRPLYDALHDMMPGDQVVRRMASGEIEVAPLAFMRGRTLSHSYAILDEAQNTSAMQMKMFLTRLGEGSRMAVTGDMTQIDLPSGVRSGLGDALEVLEGVSGVSKINFDDTDVVRHDLVTRIVRAYDKHGSTKS
ncbi:MAG: phosphate starvation-inducible protein PhoH [Alphaproteobacteria bacterium]|nr:phosphate starvation-inducible protein PhoH [Alphaproteobacteria bacterium]PPR14136.1 MAG: PhoH-like protein [Alphaproteobacteria bacterium MarineAlpha12_Bin1]